MKRTLPEKCPVCGEEVQTFEAGRVLCITNKCYFEWFHKPPKILPKTLPTVNYERLQKKNLEFLSK